MKEFPIDITGWDENSFNSIFLKKRFYYAVFVGFLAFLFVPDEALDLYRYYEFAHFYENLDLFEMIQKSIDDNLDFIYYLFFYLLIKMDLPIQLLTGISVGLYLYITTEVIDTYIRVNNIEPNKLYYYLAIVLACCSVSYIVVFAISRNLTAIVFFLMAINRLIKGNKFLTILYFGLSVFTHFGMILFLFLIGVGYVVNKYVDNNKPQKKLLILGTFMGLLSNYWISYIMVILAYSPFFAKYEIYLKYLENNLSNAFTAGFGIWDKLPFFTTMLIMFFCLLHVKKYNLVLNICLVLFLWLVTAMGFSFMFTQRTLMLILPFVGIAAVEYSNQQKSKGNNFAYIVLLGLSLAAFIINVYSYRDLWVFELP